MEDNTRYACTICGGEKADPSRWFLVSENSQEDKLKILAWDGFVASARGIHRVCCPAHVQELVVHWMATGSVHYPFARTSSRQAKSRRPKVSPEEFRIPDTTGARMMGELTVHRESMYRVLSENPGSLRSILDALGGALQPRVRNNHGPCEGLQPGELR
jgi:hypothetical protein